MNAINSLITNQLTNSMQMISARFSEIEQRTGISFFSHLQAANQNSVNSANSIAREYDGLSMALAYADEVNSQNAVDRTILGELATEQAAARTTDPLYEGSLTASPLTENLSTIPIPAIPTGAFAGLPPSEFDHLFIEAGERHGIDPALIKAIAHAESRFRPDAVSSAGARGLMQLMPGTAEALGVVDSFDPWQNIDGGTRYLAQLLDRFNGNTLLALAGYNWGSNRIISRGITDLSTPASREVLPVETRNYLAAIERYLGSAQALNVLDEPFAA